MQFNIISTLVLCAMATANVQSVAKDIRSMVVQHPYGSGAVAVAATLGTAGVVKKFTNNRASARRARNVPSQNMNGAWNTEPSVLQKPNGAWSDVQQYTTKDLRNQKDDGSWNKVKATGQNPNGAWDLEY
jgi:hypothetical protein